MSIKYEDHVPQPADPSKRHFYISLVKSVVRIAAGGAFVYAGYALEFPHAPIILGGVLLIVAEILGIAEEL
jgi:hypothetical protein|tara:strand:+ start:54 stop:266 length:213 start_codon:yes stop_codon:yes gene_type:complete